MHISSKHTVKVASHLDQLLPPGSLKIFMQIDQQAKMEVPYPGRIADFASIEEKESLLCNGHRDESI